MHIYLCSKVSYIYSIKRPLVIDQIFHPRETLLLPPPDTLSPPSPLAPIRLNIVSIESTLVLLLLFCSLAWFACNNHYLPFWLLIVYSSALFRPNISRHILNKNVQSQLNNELRNTLDKFIIADLLLSSDKKNIYIICSVKMQNKKRLENL